MAIVLAANLRSLQGSALRGPGLPARESLARPKELMARAARMVHAAPEMLQELPGAVLVPGVTVHPALTAVPGHPVIANLARNATMRLATMTRRLTPMPCRQSLTVQHGAS